MSEVLTGFAAAKAKAEAVEDAEGKAIENGEANLVAMASSDSNKGTEPKKVDRRMSFEKNIIFRVEKVLGAIDALKKYSNKTYYEYTPQDVDKIFSAIEETLAEVKSAYTSEKTSRRKFEL